MSTLARTDLDCPHVELAKLAPERYGAYGCGRGAVYARVCTDQGCRWGRLRHGHEAQVAAPPQPAAPAAPRDVTPAPPPAPRDVVPAPPQEPREIVPAPPPASDATPSREPPTNEAANAPPPAQGTVGEPYLATVPDRPAAQQASEAPPAPLAEDRPVQPATNYVWVNGYWWWGSPGWSWVPGYWCPPAVGLVYAPGYWYWSSSYWWYWPGGFTYPGSRVIVTRVPPRPRNVVTVRPFIASARSAHPIAPATSYRPRATPLLRYPGSATTSVNKGRSFGSMSGPRGTSSYPRGPAAGRSSFPSSRRAVGPGVAPGPRSPVPRPASPHIGHAHRVR